MGAKFLVITLLDTFTRLKLVWADSGYDSRPLTDWVRAVAGMSLVVIKRTEAHTFKVVPRRWVVERTFGWLLRYRRLVRAAAHALDVNPATHRRGDGAVRHPSLP